MIKQNNSGLARFPPSKNLITMRNMVTYKLGPTSSVISAIYYSNFQLNRSKLELHAVHPRRNLKKELHVTPGYILYGLHKLAAQEFELSQARAAINSPSYRSPARTSCSRKDSAKGISSSTNKFCRSARHIDPSYS